MEIESPSGTLRPMLHSRSSAVLHISCSHNSWTASRIKTTRSPIIWALWILLVRGVMLIGRPSQWVDAYASIRLSQTMHGFSLENVQWLQTPWENKICRPPGFVLPKNAEVGSIPNQMIQGCAAWGTCKMSALSATLSWCLCTPSSGVSLSNGYCGKIWRDRCSWDRCIGKE
jgi:hypothetical protein